MEYIIICMSQCWFNHLSRVQVNSQICVAFTYAFGNAHMPFVNSWCRKPATALNLVNFDFTHETFFYIFSIFNEFDSWLVSYYHLILFFVFSILNSILATLMKTLEEANVLVTSDYSTCLNSGLVGLLELHFFLSGKAPLFLSFF